MAVTEQSTAETATQIWASDDDMKCKTISMERGEGLRVCLHGLCITMPLDKWFGLAADQRSGSCRIRL